MYPKKILIENMNGINYDYVDANQQEQNLYYFADDLYISSGTKPNISFRTQKFSFGKYEWYVYIDENKNFFLISDELQLARKYLAIPVKSDTTGPANTFKILEDKLNLPRVKNTNYF